MRPLTRFGWGYVMFGLLVDGAYATATMTGWEPTAAKAEIIPPSVRSSPGGYRSFHFWHAGFQGGK